MCVCVLICILGKKVFSFFNKGTKGNTLYLIERIIFNFALFRRLNRYQNIVFALTLSCGLCTHCNSGNRIFNILFYIAGLNYDD